MKAKRTFETMRDEQLAASRQALAQMEPRFRAADAGVDVANQSVADARKQGGAALKAAWAAHREAMLKYNRIRWAYNSHLAVHLPPFIWPPPQAE